MKLRSRQLALTIPSLQKKMVEVERVIPDKTVEQIMGPELAPQLEIAIDEIQDKL